VFVRGGTLRNAGYDPALLRPGMKAVVQVVSVTKGHEATKIISIEGLEPLSESVVAQQPAVATAVSDTQPKRQIRRDRGKSIYMPRFFQSTTIDQDKEHGSWRIVKVVSVATGDFQHYVLFQKKDGGGETSNTFSTLEAARSMVGKTITPPVPEGHGVKTNVVPIRSDNKKKEDGANVKGKPKKKAA
jgi:hypothetical protein